MRGEGRECVVFEGVGEVGPLKRRFNRELLVRVTAIVAAASLLAFFILGGAAKSGKKEGGEGENDLYFPPEQTVEKEETSLIETASERQEGECDSLFVTEETESERIEDGEAWDEVISLDLSRSEMGDLFVCNYTDEPLDIEGLMSMEFSGAKYSFSEKPLVLIVHTYSGHGYSDFDLNDRLSVAEKSVVAVGALLSERLNEVGISTVHVTVSHDGGGADPYAETRKTIRTMLEIYPSVECVIDLGRFEARDEDGRPVRTVSACGGAQVRLTVSVNGSRWKDDLSLALDLRSSLNDNGAEACLPIVVSEGHYNSGESLYYLKLDVGTDKNSSHEAFFAAEGFADAFERALKKSKR